MTVKYSLTGSINRDTIPLMIDKRKMKVDLEFRRIGHTQDTWCKANGVHKTTFSSVLNGHRTSKPLMDLLSKHPRLATAVRVFIKSKKKERAREKAEKKRSEALAADNS